MMTGADYLRDYLGYYYDGDSLTDVRFSIRPDNIRIYQLIDDEEEDKYDIRRSEVPVKLWDEFVAVFGEQ